jgi:superfamily II DNA or RNA helicase
MREDLKGKCLSDNAVKRIKVDLTEDEREEYERYHRIFARYTKKKRIITRNARDFEKLIMLSGRDREAPLARNRVERIAFNSESKIEKIKEILSKKDRTIIFTGKTTWFMRYQSAFLYLP